MRRIKQQITREECIEILKNEPRGVLSVLGDDGYPYGMPMDHFYCEENGRLYFHGAVTGHKIDAIKANDKVSYCVIDKGYKKEGDWAYYFNSVILFGRARLITEPDEMADILRKLTYKYIQDDAYVEDMVKNHAARAMCIEITPEHITGKLVHEK